MVLTWQIKNPWAYDMDYIGFNGRISELNENVDLYQMKNLNSFVKKIKLQGFIMFSKVDVLRIQSTKCNFCSYHLYPLRFNWKKIHMSKVKFFNIMKINMYKFTNTL